MGAISGLLSTIMQPVVEQGSYYLGEKTGYNQKLRDDQLKQQQALGEQQQSFNFESMNKAQEQNKEMFDYTFAKQAEYNSQEAQVKRMKDAGLNVGLMYGGGGATPTSVTGSSGNMSGTGTQGGNASDEVSRKMANLQSMGMGLQLAKLQSEIDVNKSIADKNKADRDKTAGADTDLVNKTIEDITANIQNKQVQREGMLIDNKLKNIQAEIAEATQDWQIKSIERSVDILNEDYRKLVLNNNLTEETFDLVVEKYMLDNDNLSTDLIVKASNNEVNEARAKQILESIRQKDEELKQGNRRLSIEETRNIIQREINDTTKRGQDINKGVSERGQDIGQENALINAAAKNVTYGIAAQTEYSTRYKARKNREPHKGKDEKTPWYKKTIGNTFGVAGY